MSMFCCCSLRSMGFQYFFRRQKQPDKLLSGCCIFIFCCTFLLYKTSYRYNCSVCSIIADLDPVLRVRCMNDLAITHVNSHVSAIADQISRLCICVGYFCTCILLLIGCSRKADSEVRIDTLYKSGAVCTIGKACSAPYVRISYKLCGIIHNRRSGTTAVRRPVTV